MLPNCDIYLTRFALIICIFSYIFRCAYPDNLEKTGVSGKRLIIMILLMAIAYTSATIQGGEIKQMGVQKYVARVKEPRRTERRDSTFGVGLDGQMWVNFMEQYAKKMEELMSLSRNKLKYYQQGLRTARLIRSAA